MKLLATVRPLGAEYVSPVHLLSTFVSFFFPLSGSVGNLVLIFTHCECSCCSFLEMTSLRDNIDSFSVKSAGIKGQKEQCLTPPPPPLLPSQQTIFHLALSKSQSGITFLTIIYKLCTACVLN